MLVLKEGFNIINEELTIPELNNETIEQMIYVIRGQKVMLDFDLSRIYGYETKYFNRQVKRNIDRFDEDFRFKLTKEEFNNFVRCQIGTARIWTIGNEGGRTTLPYAFTEQGIYMLMTVLNTDLAIKQSKILIRTFKQMKDYIIESNNYLSADGLIKLTNQVSQNTSDLIKVKEQLKIVMDQFIDPSTYKHFLIKDGQKIEADVSYQEIYQLAKHSLIIIDDYISVKTLKLLKVCSNNIKVIVITDNLAKNKLNKEFINDFKHDSNIDITFKYNNDKFHDRYIAIDFNTDHFIFYHCGASSKDSGHSVNTIIEVQDKGVYVGLINEALEHNDLEL